MVVDEKPEEKKSKQQLWMEEAQKNDEVFAHDADTQKLLNEERPWDKEPKYFKKCKINAVAAAKILKHAMRGVREGKAKSGMSVEVMGLLVGKVQYDTYIIMDIIELPVEGAENTVVADDPKTMKFMWSAVERLEALRDERMIGWYHSHPFDYNPQMSNCFFSNIDIQNQLSWQMAYKKFVGIVVDPLRSLKRGVVEVRSFMAYKADYSPPANECPDGSIIPDKELRQKRWGNGHSRYYMLESSFFASSLTGYSMDLMVRDHLWIRRVADCTAMEPDSLANMPQSMKSIAQKLNDSESYVKSGGTAFRKEKSPLEEATNASSNIAMKLEIAQMEQNVRDMLFNNSG